jgi:hypothetical protein
MISLLAAVLLAQSSIPSVVVQPSAEERVVFSHHGFTFFVGKQTGQVVVLGDGNPTPPPTPPPVPPPDNKPVVKDVAWFSLIVDPSDPEQAQWRTNGVVRGLLKDAGVQFRTYADTERDIDLLNFRGDVTSTGLPTVILQDKSGKLVQVKKVTSIEELKLIAAGLK